MCEDCGCGDAEIVPVDVHDAILAGNDRNAAHNREHFVEARTLAINLMGSPGSGKTALLEATAGALPQRRLTAVSGDLATDNDARRLARAGIESRAITTGSACHLDARQVHRSLHDLPWQAADYFFIENVGNLVCPAVYDLGQAFNVVALSVTEGDDKPLKYPVMFRKADLVVITKVDLLPHLPGVSMLAIYDALARVIPEPAAIQVSATTGQGMDAWTAWLEAKRGALSARAGHAHHHHHHGEQT
jgi:hydrogenase nickel incorporation protein HypB